MLGSRYAERERFDPPLLFLLFAERNATNNQHRLSEQISPGNRGRSSICRLLAEPMAMQRCSDAEIFRRAIECYMQSTHVFGNLRHVELLVAGPSKLLACSGAGSITRARRQEDVSYGSRPARRRHGDSRVCDRQAAPSSSEKRLHCLSCEVTTETEETDAVLRSRTPGCVCVRHVPCSCLYRLLRLSVSGFFGERTSTDPPPLCPIRGGDGQQMSENTTTDNETCTLEKEGEGKDCVVRAPVRSF